MNNVAHDELRTMAAQLRDDFNILADELDWHLRNTNIARVVGGALGAVGGAVATVGIIATPFTAGAAAGVAAIGGTIAAGAGVITSSGAKIAKTVIEGKKSEGVVDRWNSFCRRASQFRDEHFGELQARYPGLNEFLKMGIGAVGLAEGLEAATATGVGMVVGEAASVGASVVAGGLMSSLLAGASLYDLVQGAIEIHDKKHSCAGDVFRDLAWRLDTIARE